MVRNHAADNLPTHRTIHPAHSSAAPTAPKGTLLKHAKAAGKPTRFFETAEQQIGYLANAPESVQLKQLRDAIDEAARGPGDFGGIETAWLAGDAAAIARLTLKDRDQDPDFYATIFTQRNHRFALRIAELLNGHTNIFVAIGAGHLAGPDSVQAELAKRNIVVRRL
ncbi:MAG: TraB/GumN family protein [Rhodospirillales bacterium]